MQRVLYVLLPFLSEYSTTLRYFSMQKVRGGLCKVGQYFRNVLFFLRHIFILKHAKKFKPGAGKIQNIQPHCPNSGFRQTVCIFLYSAIFFFMKSIFSLFKKSLEKLKSVKSFSPKCIVVFFFIFKKRGGDQGEVRSPYNHIRGQHRLTT